MITTDQIASDTAAIKDACKAAETAIQAALKRVHEHNFEAKGPQLNEACLIVCNGGILTALEHCEQHAQVNTARLTATAKTA